MLFNSISFLFFFPFVTLIYFIIPKKSQWIWLLITSYYFYMGWNPKYALLIAISTVITFISGILIEKSDNLSDKTKSLSQKKLWVALSFISNLLILFFFKYFSFAVSNFNTILSYLNLQIIEPKFDVLLPVGISFYTFQALSYTVDVYRKDIKAEKNLFKYALFVSFFPQLVAGPIERSKNLLQQINTTHSYNYDNIRRGLLLMAWGLFQKIVIADRIAIVVNQVYNNSEYYDGFFILFATILFAIQIYCDFAGYSNMAIGSAEVMGFKLMENFKRPYFATSVQDFWRRWHISLSTWFRDYVYIPLGGSRCSKAKKYRNIMITFLLSGFWHGANWTYIIWGGLHGFFQIIEDVLKPLFKETTTLSNKFLRNIITFVIVDFAWIFFRAPNVSVALELIKKIFFNFNPSVIFNGSFLNSIGLGVHDFIIMIISILLLFLIDLIRSKFKIRDEFFKQGIIFRWFVYFFIVFFILICGIYGNDYQQSEFIYFQF